MDVKKAVSTMIPLQLRNEKVEKSIKMGHSTDRDANGQQQQSDSKDKKFQKPSEEDINKAIGIIKSKEAVKNMNLKVEIVTLELKRWILISEEDGKVVRRISEYDIWDFLEEQNQPETKGQILRKSA